MESRIHADPDVGGDGNSPRDRPHRRIPSDRDGHPPLSHIRCGFQRAFLQHFGVSPKQYIIKLRMNKALQLLVENKLSVKEISFLCGFSDDKYFSRAFREKYGYPPSQLRNRIVI